MPKIYGNLERASLEVLSSDPAVGVTGRILWNSTDLKAKVDNGTIVAAVLLNDAKCVLGTNGTAANNIRLHRGANAVLQFVLGNDATSEGSLSTSLAQVSSRVENYTTGSLPAAANAGRLLWDTSVSFLKVDTGAAIKTLVTTDGVQTLTAKDIDGGTASNTSRLTVPKDSKTNLDALTRKEGTVVYASDQQKLYFDNGSLLKAVGTGSGGGVNLITNGDAEVDTTGWATYADAAGSRPVDGTAGSPTVTWTRSTSSPLEGDGSFLLTKDAANRQGEGASYDFTVAPAHLGKMVSVSFDYTIVSGTYSGGTPSTDSDVIVYLYRKDATARLMEVTPFKLGGAVVGQKYSHVGQVQLDSDADDYRLIFHVATTSASAFVVKIDNVKISPVVMAATPVVSDWEDATSKITLSAGWGTATAKSFFTRRVGKNLEGKGSFTSGTVTGGVGEIILPSGLVIDSSVISSNDQQHICGRGHVIVTGASQQVYGTNQGAVLHVTSAAGYDRMRVGVTAASGVLEDNSVNSFVTSGDSFTFEFSVPIAGWGSASDVVGGGDGRVVAARVETAGGQTVSDSTATKVVWDVVQFDTHAAMDLTNDRFVAPVAGVYDLSAVIEFGANATGSRQIRFYKNGSQVSVPLIEDPAVANTFVASVSDKMQLNAGDYVEVFVYQTSGGNLSVNGSGGQLGHFAVSRLSGPEQIQAGETVVARAARGAAQTIANASFTKVEWDTSSFDSHAAMDVTTNYRFTAPMAGVYSVSACLEFDTNATGQRVVGLYKNGSQVSEIAANVAPSGSFTTRINGTDRIKLVAGDYLEIFVLQTSGGNLDLAPSGDLYSYWSVERIK